MACLLLSGGKAGPCMRPLRTACLLLSGGKAEASARDQVMEHKSSLVCSTVARNMQIMVVGSTFADESGRHACCTSHLPPPAWVQLNVVDRLPDWDAGKGKAVARPDGALAPRRDLVASLDPLRGQNVAVLVCSTGSVRLMEAGTLAGAWSKSWMQCRNLHRPARNKIQKAGQHVTLQPAGRKAPSGPMCPPASVNSVTRASG